MSQGTKNTKSVTLSQKPSCLNLHQFTSDYSKVQVEHVLERIVGVAIGTLESYKIKANYVLRELYCQRATSLY